MLFKNQAKNIIFCMLFLMIMVSMPLSVYADVSIQGISQNYPDRDHDSTDFANWLKDELGNTAKVFSDNTVMVDIPSKKSDKIVVLACSYTTPTSGSCNASTSAVDALCKLYFDMRGSENDVTLRFLFVNDANKIENSERIKKLSENVCGVILFDHLMGSRRLVFHAGETENDFSRAIMGAAKRTGNNLFITPSFCYENSYNPVFVDALYPVCMIEAARVTELPRGGGNDETNCTRKYQCNLKYFSTTGGQISYTDFDTWKHIEKSEITYFYNDNVVAIKDIIYELVRHQSLSSILLDVEEQPTVEETTQAITEKETAALTEAPTLKPTEPVSERYIDTNVYVGFSQTWYIVLVPMVLCLVIAYLFYFSEILRRRREKNYIYLPKRFRKNIPTPPQNKAENAEEENAEETE